jgi:hypothetical protein
MDGTFRCVRERARGAFLQNFQMHQGQVSKHKFQIGLTGSSFFFLAQTKMSWRSLLTSQYSVEVQSCPVLR